MAHPAAAAQAAAVARRLRRTTSLLRKATPVHTLRSSQPTMPSSSRQRAQLALTKHMLSPLLPLRFSPQRLCLRLRPLLWMRMLTSRRLRCFWRKCIRISSWRRPLLRCRLLQCRLQRRPLRLLRRLLLRLHPSLLLLRPALRPMLTRPRASSAWTRRAAWGFCRASTS
jgi:hypothetical protein